MFIEEKQRVFAASRSFSRDARRKRDGRIRSFNWQLFFFFHKNPDEKREHCAIDVTRKSSDRLITRPVSPLRKISLSFFFQFELQTLALYPPPPHTSPAHLVGNNGAEISAASCGRSNYSAASVSDRAADRYYCVMEEARI